MSGSGERYGKDSEVAINIALREINALRKKSGINYPTLDVLIGDTKSKPLRAVQLARNFIDNDKVDFLCGAVSSSVALAVTKVSHDKKIIFVGTDHASPRLVDEALHPYYFRLNNGTRQSMRAGANYISQQFKVNKLIKIAFIGPDYDYGYRAWDDLRFYLEQGEVKFKPVLSLWPKLYEKNYEIYIDALIKEKPDIVINGHWGKDLVNFIRQANKTELFKLSAFMNFDAGGNYETLAELGAEMPLGIVLSARHHINWPQTKENNQFVESFYRSAGRYPSYAAEGAYSGILAIAKVLRKTQSAADIDQRIQAFKNIKLKLPEDPVGFESYMDPVSHQILQVQSIGKTVKNNAYPPATVMLGEWFDYYPPTSWSLKR
ncbi:MAG: branched-chain amino acid transport system substrate-binding protein [Cellvibrionaceae bacterium]|jgi:branched-chain amino acid transport system substrate-binding protein